VDADVVVTLRDHSQIMVHAADHARYWIDDINPYIFRLPNGFGVRWYGLAYLAGLVWGYVMAVRWWRQGRSPLAPEQLQDFVVSAGLGMIIGGRLVYCLFYGTDHLLQNPLGGWFPYDQDLHRFLEPGEAARPGHTIVQAFSLPYILKLWEGGMASHGGIAGLVAGAWWYGHRRGYHFLVLGDILAATGPFGIALGRLANFVNGELWGRPAHDLPWAMIFPQAPPDVFGFAIPRHPSQLYAMFLEGFFVLALVLPLHARHRRPGLTAGAMLTLYALGRFGGEFFREPDIGQPGSPGHAAILGFMSKGQLLTLPVFACGVYLIIRALSHPPRPEAYRDPAEVASDGKPSGPAIPGADAPAPQVER
jgi:phosphatidylglycerol:prolipoprotein diacylglycerol transferase